MDLRHLPEATLTDDVFARRSSRKARRLDQGFWLILLAGLLCLGTGYFWTGFVMVSVALILFGLWLRETR